MATKRFYNGIGKITSPKLSFRYTQPEFRRELSSRGEKTTITRVETNIHNYKRPYNGYAFVFGHEKTMSSMTPSNINNASHTNSTTQQQFIHKRGKSTQYLHRNKKGSMFSTGDGEKQTTISQFLSGNHDSIPFQLNDQ